MLPFRARAGNSSIGCVPRSGCVCLCMCLGYTHAMQRYFKIFLHYFLVERASKWVSELVCCGKHSMFLMWETTSSFLSFSLKLSLLLSFYLLASLILCLYVCLMFCVTVYPSIHSFVYPSICWQVGVVTRQPNVLDSLEENKELHSKQICANNGNNNSNSPPFHMQTGQRRGREVWWAAVGMNASAACWFCDFAMISSLPLLLLLFFVAYSSKNMVWTNVPQKKAKNENQH